MKMNIIKKFKKALIRLSALALILLTVISTVSNVTPFFAYADNNVDISKSDPLTDLTQDSNFDVTKYAFKEGENIQLERLYEYGYCADPTKKANFALYVYVYNPNAERFRDSALNRISIAVGYNSKGEPNDYQKFELKYISHSKGDYEHLFYKFMVVDSVSPVTGLGIYDRLSANDRRYDVAGIELITSGKYNATDYGVSTTYHYTGYAKGCGLNSNLDSTLDCTTEKLETINLDVEHTNYRTGEYVQNHRHDLNSVYFSVPERFFEEYGKLQKIKAEWYEYDTTPVVITSDDSIFEQLNYQKGINATEITLVLSIYSGYRELLGSNGHYNQYDFGYNVKGVVNQPCNVISYIFSTLGAGISNYKLSAERIEDYIQNYTIFDNGTVNIPGKSYSADLFEPNLTESRATVPYVDNDIHHKLVNIDAGDKFDMLNYQDSNSELKKFFASILGFTPADIGESFKNVEPIHIVSDSEINNENLSDTLFIDSDEEFISQFKDYYSTEKLKGNKTVLFRFAKTDYQTIPVMVYNEITGENLSKNGYGSNTAVAKETLFFNFDVIQLTFSNNGNLKIIPVISSPFDIVNGIEIPDYGSNVPWWYKVIAWAITIVACLIGVIIIFYSVKFIFAMRDTSLALKLLVIIPTVLLLLACIIWGVPFVIKWVQYFGGLG